MGKLNLEDKSQMLCWHNNYTSLHQAEHQQETILVSCELKAFSRDTSQSSVSGTAELTHPLKNSELSGSLPFAKLNLISFLQCKELPSHKGIIVGIDVCCNEGTPPVHLKMGNRLQWVSTIKKSKESDNTITITLQIKRAFSQKDNASTYLIKGVRFIHICACSLSRDLKDLRSLHWLRNLEVL